MKATMKTFTMNTIRTMVLILTGICLTGCLILPIPTPWVKGDYTSKEISRITPGKSTKTDVIKKLHQPDSIWETERIYIYRWKRLTTVILVAAGNSGEGIPIYNDESLLVQFDEKDRVKRIEKVTLPAFQSYGDFLVQWRDKRSK